MYIYVHTLEINTRIHSSPFFVSHFTFILHSSTATRYQHFCSVIRATKSTPVPAFSIRDDESTTGSSSCSDSLADGEERHRRKHALVHEGFLISTNSWTNEREANRRRAWTHHRVCGDDRKNRSILPCTIKRDGTYLCTTKKFVRYSTCKIHAMVYTCERIFSDTQVNTIFFNCTRGKDSKNREFCTSRSLQSR